MSGMVFPQVPAPESVGPAAQKSASPRDKRGDSQYDTISRAEQRKLDQRQGAARNTEPESSGSGDGTPPVDQSPPKNCRAPRHRPGGNDRCRG
ncbi:hypothetical protein [Marinobacter sp. X15-166B]|uniref:hypothetical protein n=1 Tax=Marinobacter sp. X15-166B TaxID=1897620 RepID=UPI00085C0A0D|nr:hypothetical protein [Marinobacter sp. X15-166B]OEY67071.1 hypothetical protein BG841_11795 [Marinobacter sp. X15-166B]